MGATSNLYWLCFTYNYQATCVYKFVLIIDFLCIFMPFMAIQQLVLWNFKSLYAWIYVVLTLYYLYIAFLALRSLMGFSENLSTGTIHPKTDEYLKVRIYMVYLCFVLALLIPLVMFIDFKLILKVTLQMPMLISICINYLLTGWVQFTFQKSLTEANDILGGTTTSLQKNQVL